MPSIQSLLKKYGLGPKKRLGQHFLAEMPTVEKIVNAAGFTKEDTVLEIGSGLGVMTAKIAQKAGSVIAVEKDPVLLDIAKAEFSGFDNITWVNADILKLDISKFRAPLKTPFVIASDHEERSNLLKTRGVCFVTSFLAMTSGRFLETPLKLIGNLPYNISSPILFWAIENRAVISSALFMMQKEVALRIAAAPGGKDYGIPSVLLQAHANCKRLFDISPKNFIPPPKVMSSIVRITFGKTIHRIENEEHFTALVKAAFGKRRKTLRNALIGAKNLHVDRNLLDEILIRTDIDGNRRPETFSVEEFARLSNLICHSER